MREKKEEKNVLVGFVCVSAKIHSILDIVRFNQNYFDFAVPD